MENILVTGGSGFIGSELISRLLERECNLLLFSRNLSKLSRINSSNVRKFEINFFNPSSLYNLNIKKVDTIIHLAASVNFFGRKNKFYDVNVLSSINLYRWGREKGVKRFVFASSIEAMGVRGKPSPATENDLVKPVSNYGESKLLAEHALRKLNKDDNIGLVILRIGNVFGPRGPFFIVPFANALLTKNKYYRFIPYYNDQEFQLIYINDLVDGIIKTVEGKNIKGTYILAGNEPMRVEDILRITGKKLGKNFSGGEKKRWRENYLFFRTKAMEMLGMGDLMSFLFAGSELGDRRTFSIEKARKELGFSQKVSIEEGIEKTLEWAKQEGILKA